MLETYMKKIVALAIGLILTLTGFAQQSAQFTQNMNNRLMPNPGFAGANDAICATLLYRNQWVGFEGRPETQLFTLHAPVRILHGGVGIAAYSDQIGQINTSSVKASYAFRFDLSSISSLPGSIGVGIGLGFMNKSFGNDWRPVDQDDPNINQAVVSQGSFDLDFGAYYNNDDGLYFGISTNHLNAADMQDVNFQVQRTWFLMAGYRYQLTPLIDLEPSTFIKFDGFSSQYDINCSAVYNQFLWGGLTYRVGDAIAPMFGVIYDVWKGTMRFGYSYDVTTSLIRQNSSGSHEISLNYCFNIAKKVKLQRHKTVRFL